MKKKLTKNFFKQYIFLYLDARIVSLNDQFYVDLFPKSTKTIQSDESKKNIPITFFYLWAVSFFLGGDLMYISQPSPS